MTSSLSFREFVAVCLLILFAWAFYMDPKNGSMQGAVLTAFATAYGFYLGGSKVGSDTAAKNADTVAAQAQAATDTASTAPKAAPDAVAAAGDVAAAAADKADEIAGGTQ